jgi:hypothetical protein
MFVPWLTTQFFAYVLGMRTTPDSRNVMDKLMTKPEVAYLSCLCGGAIW